MNFRKFYIPTVIAGLAILTSANQALAIGKGLYSRYQDNTTSQVVGNERILLAQVTTDLTGTWFCNGNDPHYVRQVGNEVWWVGQSSDGGLSYTNNFYGTVFNGQINGRWADVPKGNARNYGYISGVVISSNRINLNATQVNSGISYPVTCTR